MRVLVVEDEPSLATGVKRALTGEGYDVDVAVDGEDGLRRASSGRYDLVLLDVMLPKLNGYRVCRELRENGHRVPIIMLTAKSGEWDIVEGLDLGADDYLTKPFVMNVLLARVRARTRATTSDEHLSSGRLRLDQRARRCRSTDGDTDVEVELTGRETRLLAVMIQHAGSPIAKGDLLHLVWGDDDDSDPNVVEVYVGRLRRKLDDAFGSSGIETVRGVGYRLRAPNEFPA